MTFEAFLETYHGLLTKMFDDTTPMITGSILPTSDLDDDGPTAHLAQLEESHPIYAERMVTDEGNDAWMAVCKSHE